MAPCCRSAGSRASGSRTPTISLRHATPGPIFLALAFAASTASGATFLGSPGLGYQYGTATTWAKFLYPMGVYLGVLISIKLVASSGHAFGNRSIPEYLGDRYKSDGVRLLVSFFSLVLFFYIAGQLVSGLVGFQISSFKIS